MRLIDADKLKERDFGEYGYEMWYEIDRQPTVQAIPIPDNATNGDMIKAMFSNQTISCAIPITDRNGAKFYRTTINGVTDFTEN